MSLDRHQVNGRNSYPWADTQVGPYAIASRCA